MIKIDLDGIRMLDPNTGQTLRIYPLENITGCEVTDSSTLAFWSKSSVDIEPRSIRLQSNSYTTNTLLDIVTAATVQIGLDGVRMLDPNISRKEREYIRFLNVERKKNFVCFERVKGKLVNIAEGLELHTGVFSAVEQNMIVEFVYDLQKKGKSGELKEKTYTAPLKWMRGKGRKTIQFGCCYNYAKDNRGNLPGILRDEIVDPLPPLFKEMIRRLIEWHVLPPTCVPDSCIVNIYDEGDCIPPHIDHHDFVRPFCTVSFLSQCEILFGSNLKALGPGEFSGLFSLSLPIGSVLVLNGNGADVAKHCVPSVRKKRISITFRKMDVAKQPRDHVLEPDLQGIQPLQYEEKRTKRLEQARKRPRTYNTSITAKF